MSDKVVRGPLRITVRVKGQIAAKNNAKIRHRVGRPLKIVEVVDEGTRAEKGQVLVRFDTADLAEELRKAEAELKNATIAEEIAVKELEILKRENANALRKAQIALKVSEQELEKHVDGELPRTERQMKLKIEEAESKLNRRKESYEAIRDPELLAQGFVTSLQIEEERIALRSAEINLELAKSEYELFKKYTKPTSTEAKRIAVDTAGAELEKTRTVGSNRLKQKEADLDNKREHVRRQSDRRDQINKHIAGCVLKAPRPGLVLYGNARPHWRSRQNDEIRVGGTIHKKAVIMTLPDLEGLIVKAQINEADVTKISEGMEALVTSDAYQELSLKGKVTKIGTVPIRSWWTTSQNFEMEIELPQRDLGLKPNVSAEAEIIVAELKDILHVPISAVFNRKGHNYTFVRSSPPAPREVELGQVSDTRVEIRAGLNEGEEILLYEPDGVEVPEEDSEADSDAQE